MARKMKDSGIEWIGKIPEGWEIKYFIQLFSQVKNKNIGLREKNLLSLSYGKIKQKSIETVGGLLPDSFEGYNIIDCNDIVLRLTDLQNDQHSLRVGLSHERGIITSAYCSIRVRGAESPNYLYYYLHTFDIAKGFYGMGSGVRQGLNWDGLKYIKILLPPQHEQDRISVFLNQKTLEIDSILSKTISSIEEYKKLKQAVITQAVTKGVRGEREMKDSGIEWIGKIPKEWKKNKILRIFSTIGSGTTPKSTDNNNFDGNINWLQSGDINGNILKECKNRISFKVLSKYPTLKLYHAPFIIIAMYGASIGNLSISIIDGCVNQACCVFSHTSQNFQYMFYCLKTVQPYLIKKAVGGGQPNVSQEILKSLWVPLPPLDEQKEIADYLDAKCAEIDGLITKKEQLVKELESYK